METTIMTKTINDVMNDLNSSLKSYGLEGIEITKEDAQFVLDMYDNGNGMSYNDSLAKCLGDIRTLLDDNTTAETYLDDELEDDDTPYGGKSFIGETLRDFLLEIGKPLDSPMNKVNNWLVGCGLKPIKF